MSESMKHNSRVVIVNTIRVVNRAVVRDNQGKGILERVVPAIL